MLDTVRSRRCPPQIPHQRRQSYPNGEPTTIQYSGESDRQSQSGYSQPDRRRMVSAKANNVWLNYKLVNVQWVPAGSSFSEDAGTAIWRYVPWRETDDSGGVVLLVEQPGRNQHDPVGLQWAVQPVVQNAVRRIQHHRLSATTRRSTPTQQHRVASRSRRRGCALLQRLSLRAALTTWEAAWAVTATPALTAGSDASFILGHGGPVRRSKESNRSAQTMTLRFQNYFRK